MRCCTAAWLKAGVNKLGDSIRIVLDCFGQDAGYGVAVCGEHACKLEAQAIVQRAVEAKVMRILYCRPLDLAAHAFRRLLAIMTLRGCATHRGDAILVGQASVGEPVLSVGGALQYCMQPWLVAPALACHAARVPETAAML